MSTHHTPTTPGAAEATVSSLAKLSDDTGVEVAGLEEAREALARAKRFKAERRVRREDSATVAQRLGSALASGETDFDAVAKEAAAHDAFANPESTASKAVDRAETFAISLALQHIEKANDGQELFERIRSRVQETVEEVRDLRPALDGIRSAEEATKAGQKEAKAWAVYLELRARFDALHGLADILRNQGWIPGAQGANKAQRRYARPDLRDDDLRAARERGVNILPLLDQVADRWGPGGPFTAEEAVENYAPTRDRIEAAKGRDRYRMVPAHQ